MFVYFLRRFFFWQWPHGEFVGYLYDFPGKMGKTQPVADRCAAGSRVDHRRHCSEWRSYRCSCQRRGPREHLHMQNIAKLIYRFPAQNLACWNILFLIDLVWQNLLIRQTSETSSFINRLTDPVQAMAGAPGFYFHGFWKSYWSELLRWAPTMGTQSQWMQRWNRKVRKVMVSVHRPWTEWTQRQMTRKRPRSFRYRVNDDD